MTKLRRNHDKKSGASSWVVRVVLIGLMLLAMIYYLGKSFNVNFLQGGGNYVELGKEDVPVNEASKNMLPTSTTGQVSYKTYYTLSYSEPHEQAEWVAYNLTKSSILVKNVPRSKWYQTDHSISTGSAVHGDYTRSGYSRGHLIPAGDLAFSYEAMDESMLMSNMSPQRQGFNQGIWNELENQVRNWAFERDQVFVVTGPVLKKRNIVDYIGKNEVAVPNLFYKIILDYTEGDEQAIAFLIPNELSEERLEKYVVSIDEVEEITGIDFFADFYDESIENRIERSSDASQWHFDEALYQTRINEWNQRN